MQNETGTIQYHYDENGALSGIDSPNGSSVRYERDLLGRVITIREKATSTSEAMVTRYTYDAVGNLKTVVDPTGGVTTMVYDAANRLSQRILPNGIIAVADWSRYIKVTGDQGIIHECDGYSLGGKS